MNQETVRQQLSDLGTAVRAGKRAAAKELVASLLESEVTPAEVLDTMVQAMDEIGELFQRKEIFVPQMLVAARAMGESMALLEPKLLAAGIKPRYRAVIGTVAGDVHDIGKNLVAMMWKGAGFDVIDLGTNVPASRFLEIAQQQRPDLIGLSALLTTTMPAIRSTVQTLAPLQTSGVRIVVGGAPVTQQFANDIGADGYAADAARAVDVARSLVGAES
jgi:5-methyltetrahydrofolate--homocysteine methyltransferase